MTTLPKLAGLMQTVLTTHAHQAGRLSGFIQRRGKLDAATWTQTLVFGWLARPDATLESLARIATACGTPVSPQALDQRFTPQAADCLYRVLRAAVAHKVAAQPVAVPLLRRFTAVYLQDSTTLCLPAALAGLWPGCGNAVPGQGQAALKVQVRLDWQSGQLNQLLLEPGRTPDPASALGQASLPAGGLWLGDLGYFDLDYFARLGNDGAFWLSRLKGRTTVFDAAGQRLTDLPRWLLRQGKRRLDVPVTLGVRQRLAARLLAVRVPAAVARQRRRRLRREAKRRGVRVSERQLALARWTLLVSNAPRALLSLTEALVLAKLRWQIELLFKLWKERGLLDESRSGKPWRILCEIYAKLVGLVVQHWVVVAGCWEAVERSLVKAAAAVRSWALALAAALGRRGALLGVLRSICRCLGVGCRINKSKRKPQHYQLLLQPELLWESYA